MRRSIVFVGLSLVLLSCRPDFGERESLIAEPRILAVRAEPAESKPGDPVTYTVLVAAPDGTRPDPAVTWAFCATPKRLTENNIVSADCLRDGVRAIGGPARSVQAETPGDACSLFGPETPPGDFRPRDADPTGGYFQPVRATLGPAVAFGMARIVCDLANAPADAAVDFKNRYVPNKNPTLDALTATIDGAERPLDRLQAGRAVRFAVHWAEGDAESYVAFDVGSQAVVTRRESMRVSWFATAGAFESDRTGRTEAETETFAENTWTAPGQPGPTFLWVVLRDSRGGVAFAGYDLTLVP